ncbi:MAG TPA: cell envelope integrity protein TolA [Zoogloea sp.]|mgnify:CR=1 FL=1|uniref:cell envelope integrity protein TolA n=1 Tax=Zoogloea sp. TaxID=49181 RepID=UPI002C2CA2E4|nr:cell envelope integrity protein TolA [Zoogloea sp.]HMZ76476.1 cell envelope integrity protein TolA [Rhodocyclaceae bacterium]HNB65504.1 cell envelope integrity protein TolA [Rhodocyclaceae bacterium]HNF62341.1 cell envelope integrity protein TolA [Rhodocyclaceae bacterium]HNH17017.1 cell envelope integrity protein TolA [Zoogloea sp.]HNI49368.1 cell envelope integrity protein TolA [Zoogloea sp.]
MNPALPGNERGKWSSAALAAGVHVLLGLFLFYGVRWQNRLPEPVEVELVSAPPVTAPVTPPPPPPAPAEERPAPPPPPRPEPEPEPAPPPRKQPDIAIKAPEPRKLPPKPVKEVVKPEPKPEPKKPEPKPEPRKPEPKPEPKKPDPKPEPKPEPKPDPKAEAKARAEQARLDKAKADKDAKAASDRAREQEDRRMRELLAHDSENAKQSAQIQEELARIAGAKASAARNKAIEAYIEKIRAKVKGNIVLPPGVAGDPFALFYVDQLPDGSVIEVRLKRSTGTPQLDSAIERAIQKSSPLPRPDKPELFNRTLELKFYPLRD